MQIILRSLRMAGVWAVIGSIAGVNVAFSSRTGMAGYVAHVIASMIVFSVVGLSLGFVSRRFIESLLGAVVGFTVAVASAYTNIGTDALLRNVCLNIGGLIGATGWPLAWLVNKLVATLGVWLASERIRSCADSNCGLNGFKSPFVLLAAGRARHGVRSLASAYHKYNSLRSRDQ